MRSKYNLLAAANEIRDLLYTSLSYENTQTTAIHVAHTIIRACDANHRGIFYLAPSIASVMETALSSLKLQIEEEMDDTDSTYKEIQDLMDNASIHLIFATTTLRDTCATFTAYKNGKRYIAEITETRKIAALIIAGVPITVPDLDIYTFNTVCEWAAEFGLSKADIVANYIGCQGEDDVPGVIYQ